MTRRRQGLLPVPVYVLGVDRRAGFGQSPGRLWRRAGLLGLAGARTGAGPLAG